MVAVGGGIVTDVAGFAAATYHRGTAYVNVATSLLAQVDAAIGGKTGVNLPEGKNLVGAFWQPNAVLCDTETLSSLPPREWACGRGEIAKYAFLGDAPTAGPADRGAGGALRRHQGGGGGRGRARGRPPHDPQLRPHPGPRARGRGARPTTPTGTCATARRWPSGSLFAALLARAARAHRRRPGRRAPQGRSAASTCRPTSRPGADADELVAFMGRDKKAQQDLTFVLDGPDGVEAVRGVAVGRRGRYPGCHGCPHVSLVLLLSGPNLNLLGEREPAVYGTDTLADHVAAGRGGGRRATASSSSTCSRTTRATWSRPSTPPAAGPTRWSINAGALSHTSWSLHDAVAAFDGPVVELHLSNPAAREPFRHTSVLAPVASGVIAGFGGLGYELAIDAVAALLKGT